MTIDIGNLKTYEMKKKKDYEIKEPKKEKNLVLKAENNDSSGDDADMAYLTKRFQKMVCRNRGIPKRESSSKPKVYDLCHKCGKPRHFIKDCPLLKPDHYKHNTNKAAKRNSIPDKKFKRKDAANNVVKQDLAACGDSSNESGEDDELGDTSMMAVESEATEYDSIFALMAKSNDDDDDEVHFLDVQKNLKSYSQKKLISLDNVLIDTYHTLINDKYVLTVKLGEVEHERDDMVVVVVDLKETIEGMREMAYVDLKEIIEELRRGNSSGNIQNEKEVSSEAHIKLENELKLGAVKGSIQRWYMDSGCSKHMTRSIDDFLSLKALQGGSVSFGNGKK
ncbi:uncharacterized protein [Nicotiana tomentosiformis]|uniref:uncharacterized protein n=1 Tax=Nicotiana tomentosiformis TaxID=4098 RepID=UPI00388C9066